MREVVKCLSCNHRLFDLEADGSAVVNIKCPKCKNVNKIERSSKVKVT